MLIVHRSERADRLVEALGDVVAVPLADPITTEVVAVPTRGVERWLSQRLAHRLGAPAGGDGGVCANLRFPFPGTLISEATAAACELDPERDPWRPERAVWALLELVDAHAEDPRLRPLLAHLEAATPAGRPGEERRLRRYPALRHVADLYDHYAVHRPGMLRAWAAGEAGPAVDDPTAAWQAHLWRLLRVRLGVPSPAERSSEAARRLVEDPAMLGLPERIGLFGLTRLPASQLELLQAIAVGRDVHLYLLHPSGALWSRLAVEWPDPPRGLPRSADRTAALPSHPLLRSWGRDAREMQLVLAAHGIDGGEHRPAVVGETAAGVGPGDAEVVGPLSAVTALHCLQADIRADRRPPGPPADGDPLSDGRVRLSPDDRSLQLHSCHGRARQVEVLRDAILHLLEEDDTLEPRDVIVMCPDIEAFAPLVQAAFGAEDPARPAGGGGGSDATGVPTLRVRLADRSIRQTNPLLAVAAHLLELAAGRVTAPSVLDLAARAPVSRRFRLDQDDLATLERWVAGTGVRWGLDAEHRGAWHLRGVGDNTWSAGLDRLLLGVALSADDGAVYGGAAPYDDVPSGAVDLAGRMAELVDRLGAAVRALAGPQSVRASVEALVAATEALAVAAAGDEWQHDQLRGVLAEVVDEAGAEGGGSPAGPPGEGGLEDVDTAGGAGPMLSLAEVQALLAARLQGRPTRANFRTGDLTVCTLVPMRSVPHRVVALLGLDDSVFPRHPHSDGDDLLLASPCVGDRDGRSEDRQLLLDAVLAATDRVVITYSGRDERTNRRRPPAVPVAELLDVLDATFRTADGRPARDVLTVAHPLQPFDRRNFTPGKLGGPRPWGFDPAYLAGARAAGHQRPPAPWLPGPLSPPDGAVLALDDLVRFVEHPVRAFFRQRVRLYDRSPDDELLDELPLELDPLQRWDIGDRMLTACLGRVPVDQAEAAERAGGLLPPGALAGRALDAVRPSVEALLAATDSLGGPGPADSLDVHVELPGGPSLLGTVGGVRDRTIVACVYSRLAPKHRLAAWVRFLAVTAARPELAIAAVTIGRSGAASNPRPAYSRLALVDGDPATRQAVATAQLLVLVDLWRRGMQEPLPLACATSAAWAKARHHEHTLDEAAFEARKAWESRTHQTGEQDDREHVRVWGRHARFEQLTGDGPRPDERAPGWPAGEASRFGCLARRLWEGLLTHEQEGMAT